jgi:ribosomal protein S10
MLKLTKTADTQAISFNLKRLFSASAIVCESSSDGVKFKEPPRIKLAEFLKDPQADQKLNVRQPFDAVTNQPVKFYDPPYLERKAPFPNYKLLNINIHGYDYTSLDSNLKFIRQLCGALKVTVVESYPMPARVTRIKTLLPFSTNVDKECLIHTYHRVARVQNVKSTVAPLLFEAIQLNLAEGVSMNVTVPTADEDEFRYVPDTDLAEMKAKFQEMGHKSKYEKEIEAAQAAAAKAAVKAAQLAKVAAVAAAKSAAPTTAAKPGAAKPAPAKK